MNAILTQSPEIVNMISSIGFPALMCLLLFNYITKSNETITDMTREFTEALNHNTVILQKLCDRIDKGVNVDNEI